jgi:hypothetical protein
VKLEKAITTANYFSNNFQFVVELGLGIKKYIVGSKPVWTATKATASNVSIRLRELNIIKVEK